MSAPVLYSFPLSGHSHRARLFLSLLGIEHRVVDVALGKGEHKTDTFKAMNPFGQVPVLEHNGAYIWDSNAILTYLAKTFDAGSTWLPDNPVQLASVQQWLSVAAGPLAYGPATARLVGIFGAKHDLDRAKSISESLFAVMDTILAKQEFLTGAMPTIADVAMYSYTARAPEGYIELTPFPYIRSWLARVEALPGFVAMPVTEPKPRT